MDAFNYSMPSLVECILHMMKVICDKTAGDIEMEEKDKKSELDSMNEILTNDMSEVRS